MPDSFHHEALTDFCNAMLTRLKECAENSEDNTTSADQMTQSLTRAQIARKQSIVTLSERLPNLFKVFILDSPFGFRE
jgi:hypothetical protein